MSTNIRKLQEKYANFKQERSWEKFHQPKNIAMSISIESAELMELFQWKDNVPLERIKEDPKLMDSIREELADIVLYCLSMSQRLDIDLVEAVESKIEQNHERFDLETSEEINHELEEWQKE